MKSNSKHVRDAAKAYLLDCIMSVDPQNWGKDTDDLKTRLEIIVGEFDSTANYPYNLQKFPNNQDRFIDWLKGLPSCLPLDFYTFEIVTILTGWGLPQREGKPYGDDQSESLYYHIIYSELNKLFTQNGIQL